MMDGLYEFRMLTPTAIRFGVLLKHGPLLLGRAGDTVAIGTVGVDDTGPAADLMLWTLDPAPAPSIEDQSGTHIRLRGLMSRGSARLVADHRAGNTPALAVDLSLVRAPLSRAVFG